MNRPVADCTIVYCFLIIKIGSAILIRQSVAKIMPRLLKLSRSELNYRELVRKARHLIVLTFTASNTTP